MIPTRWLYKVVDVPIKMFSGSISERSQVELDKMGAQGWELVSTTQPSSADSLRMFFKKAV